MQIGLQLGHVARQEAPVLADAVAAQRHFALGHVLAQKGDQLRLRLLFRHLRGLDALNQAAAPVCALVPGVHAVQQDIALVDGEHRTFHPHIEVGIGDHHRDFDDAVVLGVQPRHFAVQPHQVEVGLGQHRGFGGGGKRHPQIVAYTRRQCRHTTPFPLRCC